MNQAPSEARELSARSVVASTLLGAGPRGLTVATLVRSAALFDVSEGAARTAMSRMAAAGEVVNEGGRCRLSGPLARRRERQRASLGWTDTGWDGTWEVHVVPGGDARPPRERAALREAARVLRLASLRDGVWGRPANLDRERSPESSAALAARCVSLMGGRLDLDAALVGVADLWPLDQWAGRARELQHEMTSSRRALHRDGTAELRAAFLLSAAVWRHLQADPLLPVELLTRRWPGPALRAAFEAYDAGFREHWRAWIEGA